MSSDNRQVVLLKSQRTLNRFYTLAPPERGWRNAEEIADFPDDVLLGIAYPCLEDGLNDFAVIRTTFETMDMFPDDADLRTDLMGMVLEARENIHRRLSELRDRLKSRQAHFLGTNLGEFKRDSLALMTKGVRRQTMDSMMKLDGLFAGVSAMEAEDGESDPMYYYKFRDKSRSESFKEMNSLDFIVRIFDDVIEAAMDDASYENKYTFDRDVFQKFIGLMFVNYATTDPIFYGTKREDYEVTSARDMSQTPLYKAVGEALRDIERQLRLEAAESGVAAPDLEPLPVPSSPGGTEGVYDAPPPVFPDFAVDADEGPLFHDVFGSYEPELAAEPASRSELPDATAPRSASSSASTPPPAGPPPKAPPSAGASQPNGRVISLPDLRTTEQRLLVPLNSLTMAVQLLKSSSDPMAAMYGQMILTSAEALQTTLKEWGVLEP